MHWPWVRVPLGVQRGTDATDQQLVPSVVKVAKAGRCKRKLFTASSDLLIK